MRYVNFLLVPMLFVSFAFINIGGCAGSDGGGSNVTPTDPPPSNTPPPTDPRPTDPPTPTAYQIPALNTNFSDEGYSF